MIEEKIVVGKGTDYPLDGLLTIPTITAANTATGTYPAVVLVQGSGATDKDETIRKIKPFRDIAHGLAQRGVASIRYDKRNYAHGKKMRKHFGRRLTVMEEVIEDAVRAANLLKVDPRINSEQIYVVGHSLGGVLAPRIDATADGSFAGLVMLAGSPRKMEDLVKDQQKLALDALTGIKRAILKWQVDKVLKKFENIYDLTDAQAIETPFLGGTSVYYLKDMGEWPMHEYLRNSTKPILIMHGDKDLQVSTQRDFNLYKELLADNPNASFKLYDGLNHTFMPALTDNIMKVMKEFKVERPVEDYVIADMADWILSND